MVDTPAEPPKNDWKFWSALLQAGGADCWNGYLGWRLNDNNKQRIREEFPDFQFPGLTPHMQQPIAALEEQYAPEDVNNGMFFQQADIENIDAGGLLFFQADFGGAKFSGTATFEGTEFSGHTDFGGAEFSGDRADFEGATFSGTATFEGTEFSEESNFKSAEFSGAHADFGGAKFSGESNFERAIFSGAHADFGGAEFSGTATFEGTEFSGHTDFGGAEFSGDFVRFGGDAFSGLKSATFSNIADFRGAKFSGAHADFRGARFSGDRADFGGAEFSGESNFERAVFSGDTNFRGAIFSGEANFKSAKFSGEHAYFNGSEFSGTNTYFGDAEFSGYAIFGGSTFSGCAYFRKAEFSGHTDFSGTKFSGDADFRDTEFSEEANFNSTEFKASTVFSKAIFHEAPRFHNAKLYTDTSFDGTKFKPPKDREQAGKHVRAFERLTRIMDEQQRAEQRHKFFRLEMRARRKRDCPIWNKPSTWSGFLDYLLSYLYGGLCDYGYGVGRALFLWGVHMLAFAFTLFWVAGGEDWDLFRISLAVSFANAHAVLTLRRDWAERAHQSLIGNAEEAGNLSWLELWVGVEMLTGTILLFLLLLTLRNRFRIS